MAFKDILLHMDNSPSCPERLDLAVNLASAHGAHLKGLYVISHSYYASRQSVGESEVATLQQLFTEKTSRAGISAEWICSDWPVVGVSITEIITLYAYYSDLVIIGQPDHSDSISTTPPDLPERLGLGAGRPLLVVPYAGNYSTTGDRVMVAWKAGRESARAVNDAMPFLERARHVSIVTVGNSEVPDSAAERAGRQLCAYLACHRIAARLEHIFAASGFPIGDLLLNHACDQKMDLLVTGAFGQSRRGAFMLGPVAGHLLNHMTLPLLISH
jgi:nucleotide-binding universal stress UspA family protein